MLIKKKRVRDRVFARKKREPNNARVDEVYKIARNRVNRKIHKSKKEHEEAYFAEHQADIKKNLGRTKKIGKCEKKC